MDQSIIKRDLRGIDTLMSSVSAQPVGDILEPEVRHLDNMAAIYKHGQNQHHEAFSDIFCPAVGRDEIIRHMRHYFPPKNPFKSRRNYSLAWIVENELRGYLLYQLYETSNIFYGKECWICFVDDIAVDPIYRSHGGASMLLTELTKKLEKLGDYIVSGQVWNGNDASVALFRKHGFDNRSNNFYRTNR